MFDGHLFLSARYGIGAMYGKIGPSDLKQIWSSNDVMSSQYATCVFDQGVLFGVGGREDQGVARLRCFDPETGNVRWQKDGFGMATPILADGKLVLLKTDGTLVLVAASPAAYRELGRAKLFETTTRPLPALASGMLYARDTRVLKCIDLRK